MNFEDMRLGRFFTWMLVFIPISVYFALFTDNKTLMFVTALLAIIPLARIIGFATKQVYLQTNPAIGGLLSATFGNSIELLIAILALRQGLVRVVEASIIGSIIGNILLLIGLALFAGGLKYKHQRFNKETIGVSATMLIIAVVGLAIPSFYSYLNAGSVHIQTLSNAVVIVLALIYIAGLVFSMRTHRDMFDSSDEIRATRERPIITKKTGALILLLATILAAIESEFLVKGMATAIANLGITETFTGIVIIAIVTNIAEKYTAVTLALENKLDIALEIGMSSAIQIALFVVPILIFVSQIFGYGLLLVFSPFEIISLVLAVMIINHLSSDGRCNWLEGAQLISVYAIIAIAFYFI